ncbi:uncharacterized protein [Acropora muricata]|uniref:uncharacterized protein n=1 Tax=Acropora muricata TaxID=159855 RepID=UPI0034E43D49
MKFLYDIIAIKKGHFGCLPVALPGSKTSLVYARNSLASDPSPFRRCSAFQHFHSQSTSIFRGPYERQSVCVCLSWTSQILKTRLFSEYITACSLQPCRRLASAGSKNSTLQDHLVSRSKASGPLMVAAFMQEVLTNPLSGYNMNEQVNCVWTSRRFHYLAKNQPSVWRG